MKNTDGDRYMKHITESPRTVLVCGGRGYMNIFGVFRTMNALHAEHKIGRVIHGGAAGADRLAGRWARSNKVEEVVCEAAWKLHGRAAGPIRNSEMLDMHPGLVVAFPGGAGTADMVSKARAAGIPVFEYV